MKYFYFFILYCFVLSCSTKRNINEDENNGYIIELQKGNSNSIDNEVGYWFVFDSITKTSNAKYYNLLLKDIYDVKHCSDDIVFEKQNEIYKKEIDSLMNEKFILNWKNFKKNKHLKINIEKGDFVFIYKVGLRYSICSKKYSLFPEESDLNRFIYPYQINFKKLTSKEKKFLRDNKQEVFRNLK